MFITTGKAHNETTFEELVVDTIISIGVLIWNMISNYEEEYLLDI